MHASSVVQQQEEERLKSWIQELRHERRRLEDRLLLGDPQVRFLAGAGDDPAAAMLACQHNPC